MSRNNHPEIGPFEAMKHRELVACARWLALVYLRDLIDALLLPDDPSSTVESPHNWSA